MLTDRVARVVQRTLVAHFGIDTLAATVTDALCLIGGMYANFVVLMVAAIFNVLCLVYVVVFAFKCMKIPAFVDMIAFSIMLLVTFIVSLVPFVVPQPVRDRDDPTEYLSFGLKTVAAGVGWGQVALLLFIVIWVLAFTIARKHDWRQPFARSRYEPKMLPSGCRRDRRAQMAAAILLAWIGAGSVVGVVFNSSSFTSYMAVRSAFLNANEIAPAFACLIPLIVVDALMIVYAIVFMVVRSKSRRYVTVGWHVAVLTVYFLVQIGAGTGAYTARGIIYSFGDSQEYNEYQPTADTIIAWVLASIAFVTILFEAIFTSVHHGSAGWQKPFAQYSTSREAVGPIDPHDIHKQADQFDIDGDAIEMDMHQTQMYTANPIRPESKAWTDPPPASVADYSTTYTPYDPPLPLPVQHSLESKPRAAASPVYPGASSSTSTGVSSSYGAASASASASGSGSRGMDDLELADGSEENLPTYPGEIGRSSSVRRGHSNRHRNESPPPPPPSQSGWGRTVAGGSGGIEKARLMGSS